MLIKTKENEHKCYTLNLIKMFAFLLHYLNKKQLQEFIFISIIIIFRYRKMKNNISRTYYNLASLITTALFIEQKIRFLPVFLRSVWQYYNFIEANNTNFID